LTAALRQLSDFAGLAGVLQLWHVLALALAAACLPTLPGIYSFLIYRAVRPFLRAEAAPLPPLPGILFPVGLLLGAASWAMSGLGLWAAVQAVHPLPLSWGLWADTTAYLGLATVIGFFTPVPAGLGVREIVLLSLLLPDLGEGPAALAVLLFRVAWMVSEMAAAAIFYPFGFVIGREPMIQSAAGK
jgi:uncharacterized membrane protein YbhN (UPF0104 family)